MLIYPAELTIYMLRTVEEDKYVSSYIISLRKQLQFASKKDMGMPIV